MLFFCFYNHIHITKILANSSETKTLRKLKTCKYVLNIFKNK